jgi:two-component sensor histidine kinase
MPSVPEDPRAPEPAKAPGPAAPRRPSFTRFALGFIERRAAGLAAAVVAYAAVVLALGPVLAVSSNYFVILPVAAAALGFGTRGGLAAGALGLPANLLLFALLGRPDFSPASKPIAELSGIAVGFLFGRFADYLRDVEVEMARRRATEEALLAAVAAKELLLRELSHRVKNNLSVIKSIIQLQRTRSRDPAFVAAADELMARVFAISLVHDQLARSRDLSRVDPAAYLEALAGNLAGSLGLAASKVGLDLRRGLGLMPAESATKLGLIVNEVLTNAIKHASRGLEGDPAIRVSLREEGELYSLVIEDDGPGPPAELGREAPGPCGAEPCREGLDPRGLGLKLVRSLAASLRGEVSLGPALSGGEVAGARFELRWPREAEPSENQASPMKG